MKQKDIIEEALRIIYKKQLKSLLIETADKNILKAIEKAIQSQNQKIIEEIEKMDFEFLYKSQVEDVKKELLKTLGEKQ